MSVVLLTLAAVTGAGLPASAGGFREQLGWQFRNPAEATVKLNKEAQRLQANGLNVPGAGTAIGLGGLGGLNGGGGRNGGGTTNNTTLNTDVQTESQSTTGTTTGNSVSGTTTYNVTVEGDNNTVTLDGYLNLSTSQTSTGQTSTVSSERK